MGFLGARTSCPREDSRQDARAPRIGVLSTRRHNVHHTLKSTFAEAVEPGSTRPLSASILK
ncbi:MAG: hypothetical protein EPO21_03520 [Chloroflexota bacterium]|nr:MAG: hypothetical protein EPO21_03520 [Chloroflexota bacterium]